MAEAIASPPALLVFADDWGRHPSSCQHLIRCLLPRYPVYWVNTIGLRTPRLDVATVRRGLEKSRQWLRPASGYRSESLPANLHVLNPRMWPWFSSAFSRWLNRVLLCRQLVPQLKRLTVPAVGITTLPIVADLMGRLPLRRWVYYCVDDFGQWPGLDHLPLRQMEERLVRKADSLIAVSETLRDKLAKMGRPAQLLTHGVDLECWHAEGDGRVIPQLKPLEPPLLAFWGMLDRRLDVAWLQRLAAGLTRGTIVLVGPELDPDPAVLQTPRLVHLPPLPFWQLPHLARAASVLIMPYADLPVTRAIQPLKLKEYLATGKPVVARTLPATRGWGDCLDLADTAEEFAQAVRLRMETGVPPAQQAARARLAEESWVEKARLFESWAIRGDE